MFDVIFVTCSGSHLVTFSGIRRMNTWPKTKKGIRSTRCSLPSGERAWGV